MTGLEKSTIWLLTGAGYAIWCILVLVIGRLLFPKKRKPLKYYRFPILSGLILGGLAIAIKFLPFKPEHLTTIHTVLKIAFIVLIILFINNLFSQWLRTAQKKNEFYKSIGGVLLLTVRIFLAAIAFLIILQTLDIKITAVLASLGIGSLAVALALRDTLENFFAGLYIIAEKPVRVGDFIKLESGEEGYVESISWRTTRMRMLPNNIVVIPNSRLSASIVTNYFMPEKELSILVQVGVSYDSDLQQVERVTIEVARELQRTVEGAVPDFEPFIRYNTFSDFSINFTVIIRAKEFVNGYLLKHEFVKRLHERYKKENIVIPFPIRTLHVPPGYIDPEVMDARRKPEDKL